MGRSPLKIRAPATSGASPWGHSGSARRRNSLATVAAVLGTRATFGAVALTAAAHACPTLQGRVRCEASPASSSVTLIVVFDGLSHRDSSDSTRVSGNTKSIATSHLPSDCLRNTIAPKPEEDAGWPSGWLAVMVHLSITSAKSPAI